MLWSSVFYAVVLWSIVMLYVVGVLWSCGVLCWTVVDLWCFMVECCGVLCWTVVELWCFMVESCGE